MDILEHGICKSISEGIHYSDSELRKYIFCMNVQLQSSIAGVKAPLTCKTLSHYLKYLNRDVPVGSHGRFVVGPYGCSNQCKLAFLVAGCTKSQGQNPGFVDTRCCSDVQRLTTTDDSLFHDMQTCNCDLLHTPGCISDGGGGVFLRRPCFHCRLQDLKMYAVVERVSGRKTPFVQPRNSDLLQILEASPSARASPFHQISWKSVEQVARSPDVQSRKTSLESLPNG